MKKDDLIKTENPGQWKVNGDLYNEVIKKHLGKNICFGEMYLPKICYLPKEIPAKTKKEAEQKLVQVILELAKVTKERMKKISECQCCENFDRCFKLALLEVIRNVTRSA